MRCCRVVGPMWASVKHPAYAGHPLFVVQPLDEHGKDAGNSFVAIDHAQAGVVRQILGQGDIVPIRSIIVGIVDHVETA